MRRNWFLLIAIVGLAACSKKQVAQPPPPYSGPPSANGAAVTVTVNQSQPGYVVPATFQGLSYETGILANGGNFLSANNSVLIQLIKNLGPGILRVGGNSSDETFWTGRARTANTGKDSLSTTDIDNFSAFAKAIGWPVLFGLNLGANNPAAAADEAKYVKNDLANSLYALQTGNEPDLYYENGHRTASYTYANYQTEWLTYFSAVRSAVPLVPFAGPDVASNTTWVSSFATNESSNVILIDGHYYNTGPATSASITYQTILAPNTKLSTYLQSLNTSSSKYHLPYRISECNSVYDGGKAGVSDVFASSLWALDFMWTVAENNGQGVNFHGGSGGAYSPFVLSNGVITAQPEYYAMLAFKYGSTGATIVPATVAANSYNCTAYACINGNSTYVTLINKDTNNISFTIQLTKDATNLQIARLTAPTITSTTDITFVGSSVSADGTFKTGTPEQYAITGKSFVINVPAGSAAVITVQ
jgi:hypothetical protein